ncbi:MAG: hypothetical protein R8G33_10825 [Gammaproteobacteria bacterium]|nr:hypothetical protein [Gammaproteobacteria bacterium]
MRIFSFRNFRVLVLLITLATVALYVKDQKLVTQGWYKTLDIVVYPINPTNSPIVKRYIDSLTSDSFSRIDKLIKRESKKYNIVSSVPTKTRLGRTLTIIPPDSPELGSGTLDIILWSLKLRIWLWQNAPDEVNDKHLIRMFVLYHDPSIITELKHSVGLQKGLVGIVNAYGIKSQSVQNSIVITHEFLHTVGASDKYDEFGNPVFPDGLGNPNQTPLYPQKKTEIMAGRRALSASHSEMPNSFKRIVIGEKTAREIGWLSDI